MHHLDVVLGEHVLLTLVNPDAMSCAQARRRELEAREVLDVRQTARQLAHDGDLIARFGGVGMNQDAFLGGKARNGRQQIA